LAAFQEELRAEEDEGAWERTLRIFEPKPEEVTRSSTKLHNKKLHNHFFLPNIIITLIK
jgi:hypothetical protein